MSRLSDAEIVNQFLSKLRDIEKRTWNNFYPKEKKRFAKLVLFVNDLKREIIESVEPNQILIRANDALVVGMPAYKEAFDTVDFKALQNHPSVKNTDAFMSFYPGFLNVYALEVANAKELGIDDKIFALNLIRDTIEKESLLFNVNMFPHFQVVLNFIKEKLPQLQIERNEKSRVYESIRKQIEAEDFYYWPLRIEKAESFFKALELHKLIEPGQKCVASFQERFDLQNQIVWSGEKRQLIYLMFLLYGNQRKFNGLGIHEIACHVFKQDPELQPRSLNNQLLKIINPGNNLIRRDAIDDSLRIIEDLIEPFFQIKFAITKPENLFTRRTDAKNLPQR